MRPSAASVPEHFARRYRAEGTAERAAGEKAYLKSELRFHGVTMPQIRRAAAEWVRAHPELDGPQLRAAARALFESDYFDLRSTGIALLERRVDLLDAGDLAELIGVVRSFANWAHVDWLAAKVIGALVKLPRDRKLLLRWGRDPSLWVRRTAMLAQLDRLRAGEGDFELFEAIAEPLLEEKEFFIRKAIGWVLREVSKKRPELVVGFLSRHGGRISGLSRREAEKYLPASATTGRTRGGKARPAAGRW
jgi:3-methyladenine DNA glycosylase AlkD